VLSIVLVEDSPAVRNRLREILAEIESFQIAGEYETATDAIAAIAVAAPDVVLLDIKLRMGNGIEVLRQLRRQSSATIVIVFSQHDDPGYREQFASAGADHFFNKTCETTQLIAVLTGLAKSAPGYLPCLLEPSRGA
jgi:DNA-binding NarL/FixJ family response regulator